MRILVVAVLVLGTTLAVADSKQEVDAIVRKHVERNADELLAADAEILVKGGHVKARDVWEELLDLHGDYATRGGGSNTRVSSLDVVADDAHGTAWFHGRVTITVQLDGYSPSKTPIRINGIAIKDKTWKIVALSYSEEVTDRLMIERAEHVKPALVVPTTTVVHGDAALAKAASEWFSSGTLAGGASGSGKLVANGTSGGEYGNGAAATKLATAWGKLKLAAYKVEATTFAGGSIGFVRVVVALPVAKPKRIVPLVLAAVVVAEKTGWRWVSLNWTDFSMPPSDNAVDVK